MGGCVVTSAEEFVEEPSAAPLIVDSPGLPLGSIIAFDRRSDHELRIGISVRDDNIEDVLQVHAEVVVAGDARRERICAPTDIMPSGEALRERLDLMVEGAKIRPRVCNKLEVYVSRKFFGSCTNMPEAFTFPAPGESVARAQFLIWEVTDEPNANPSAATAIVTSCLASTS